MMKNILNLGNPIRKSIINPLETWNSNVMGTISILESVRSIKNNCVVTFITSDKVYKNQEWVWGYRETDRLGGKDPYSASKGMAELAIRSYTESFFNTSDSHITLGVARAGNVIGGGDWAKDRIVPDCMSAWSKGDIVEIRNPNATRPWQHVLEPLSGYLKLAEQLEKNGDQYAEAWNFGPAEIDARPVQWIIEKMAKLWGENANWINDKSEHPHEANYLKLDCSKAHMKLNWYPRWDLSETLLRIVEWHKLKDAHNNYRKLCLTQINDYMGGINK